MWLWYVFWSIYNTLIGFTMISMEIITSNFVVFGFHRLLSGELSTKTGVSMYTYNQSGMTFKFFTCALNAENLRTSTFTELMKLFFLLI